MSYRFRINSIFESTMTQAVLSGELLEGTIPEGMRDCHSQVGHKRVDMKAQRAVIFVVYNQKDQKQRSTFIRVTNPPVDCTHLVGLTLSNDDPYSPKPLTNDARAELESFMAETRQIISDQRESTK